MATPAIPKPVHRKLIPSCDPPGRISLQSRDIGASETVRVELTALLPGTSEAGENEHVAPAGCPEQDSATAFCKIPETGVTVSVVVPDFPTVIVNVAGAAPRLI